MTTLDELEEIKDIVVLFKTRNTIYMGGEKSETFNHKNTIGNEFKGIFEDIEKSLKALEIIKEKKVDVFRFKTLNFDAFNQLQKSCRLPELTEEEFNLLKEVLQK